MSCGGNHGFSGVNTRVTSARAPDALGAAQAVSTRACYLFARLVKALRSELRPLLADVLAGLQPHLQRIVSDPPSEALASGGSGHARLAAASKSQPGTPPPAWSLCCSVMRRQCCAGCWHQTHRAWHACIRCCWLSQNPHYASMWLDA